MVIIILIIIYYSILYIYSMYIVYVYMLEWMSSGDSGYDFYCCSCHTVISRFSIFVAYLHSSSIHLTLFHMLVFEIRNRTVFIVPQWLHKIIIITIFQVLLCLCIFHLYLCVVICTFCSGLLRTHFEYGYRHSKWFGHPFEFRAACHSIHKDLTAFVSHNIILTIKIGDSDAYCRDKRFSISNEPNSWRLAKLESRNTYIFKPPLHTYTYVRMYIIQMSSVL